MGMDSGQALPRITSLSWINLFANTSDQIATVALPVVYVNTFSGDAGANSILTVAATLPLLIFSLPIGALADRMQLKLVLLGGELVRLVSLLVMMLVVSMDSPALLVLAFLALLGGTGTVAFQVAAPSLVARTTSGDLRTQLNGSIELSRSIAVTAGPPLAGMLVGFTTGSMAFAASTALAGAAAVAIMRLPSLTEQGPSSTTMRQQLMEGIRFTFGSPWLRSILFVSLGFNMGWYMLLGVIVAWCSLELGMGSLAVGMMFAGYGLGMITGATWMDRIGSRYSHMTLVRMGPYCGLSFALLVGLTAFLPLTGLVYTGFFLIGVGPIIWTITTVGIRQAVAPHHLLGRVSATNMMISAGARPVGAGIGYVLFQVGGYEMVFLTALLLFGIQAIGIGRTILTGSDAPAAVAEA